MKVENTDTEARIEIGADELVRLVAHKANLGTNREFTIISNLPATVLITLDFAHQPTAEEVEQRKKMLIAAEDINLRDFLEEFKASGMAKQGLPIRLGIVGETLKDLIVLSRLDLAKFRGISWEGAGIVDKYLKLKGYRLAFERE